MRKILVMSAMVAALASSRAVAWNDTGHMTVALIAYRNLSDAHRQQVAAILQEHPHYKLFLSRDVPGGVSEDEWAFLKASTWPDFVRPSRPGTPDELFKGPEITRYHQSPWHYVDYPYVPHADRGKVNATTLPSHTEPSILTALEAASKEMSSRETSAEKRAISLAWMEHLCGDIHQPLHAATLWSAQFPAGDRGGNEIAVRANGDVVRLHAFWDSAIGSSDAYETIVFLADHIVGQDQLQKQRLPQLAAHASFASWADESHEYAIALAYLNGRLRGAVYRDYDQKLITADQVPNLSASYLTNAHNLAERRIAMAGYRLADQIRRALAASATKPSK